MESARCPAHPDASLRPAVVTAGDRFWGHAGTFTYGQCPDCATWVLDPRPTAAEIGPFYAGYYNAEELGARRRKADKDGAAGALGFDRLRALDAVRRLGKLGAELGPGRRLLDAGCGLGAFARAMRDLTGIEVRGVDFDARCAAFAAEVFEVPVDVGVLAAQGYPEGAFDLVTSWHCLEHVHDPPAELAELARVTRPGGRLLLEVPTLSAIGRLFRGRWLFLQAPTHLYHFAPVALRALVERAGFEVEAVTRPWMPTELAGSVMMALGLHGFAPRVMFPRSGWRAAGWRVLLAALLPLDVVVTLVEALLGGAGVVRLVARRKEVA